ncbi:acyl-CoA thioester hydrolase/BAAT C-terminal domain-containing protein [Microbacterium sp. NPDC056234]|uniref:acyl-CoA thioester hydrolase/BAAT C-terminal domain-containing protein n=1 Tax=Microbacterium sp. NPDC056234 TaxID=3345757 RepID=UPI0035DDF751
MTRIDETDRHVAAPANPTGSGILVLAGSSGRIESERADLLARHGVRAHAIRWFGGQGQRPVPHEVPLELFVDEVALLRDSCDRVAILGTSFGAEAALLTATRTPVDAVIAIAPTSVVWPGILDGSWSSHWTEAGAALPWVPFVEDWTAPTDPPEFRGLYAESLDRHPLEAEAAAIPVERITGELLLVVGEDDRVWPSGRFADEIVGRRSSAGLPTDVLRHSRAGHRVPFPGEAIASGGHRMARGGSPEADAELGALAWDAVLALTLKATRPS